MKGNKGVAKVTVECVYHVIRWCLLSHTMLIGIGVAAVPYHGGGCGSGSGGARSFTTGGIVTSSHRSGFSSLSPMTCVPHYHTSNLSLASESDMKGNSSNNSNIANGKNNNSINSMNHGFEMFDLPTNSISYIFSYSGIKSSLNIEKCCKICCVIERSVFFILTGMMLNICLLFHKVTINRYLIPQILNFQVDVSHYNYTIYFQVSIFANFLYVKTFEYIVSFIS